MGIGVEELLLLAGAAAGWGGGRGGRGGLVKRFGRLVLLLAVLLLIVECLVSILAAITEWVWCYNASSPPRALGADGALGLLLHPVQICSGSIPRPFSNYYHQTW